MVVPKPRSELQSRSDTTPWSLGETGAKQGAGISPDTEREILDAVDRLVDSLRETHGTDATSRLTARRSDEEKPFLWALFPEIVKASELERSLSGMTGSCLEEVAATLARAPGHHAETQHVVTGTVTGAVMQYIDQLVRDGRAKDRGAPLPNLEEEMAMIRGASHGVKEQRSQKVDVYVQTSHKAYYFDMKTVKPNSEQVKQMKKRLMLIRALRLPEDVAAHGVLPYNPKGEGEHWTPGPSYLDYNNAEVLVGEQFWDGLAGPGTFRELLALFGRCGLERREDLRDLLR